MANRGPGNDRPNSGYDMDSETSEEYQRPINPAVADAMRRSIRKTEDEQIQRTRADKSYRSERIVPNLKDDADFFRIDNRAGIDPSTDTVRPPQREFVGVPPPRPLPRKLQPPGDLVMFEEIPETSTTDARSQWAKTHYQGEPSHYAGEPSRQPGERPDRFDAPRSTEYSDTDDMDTASKRATSSEAEDMQLDEIKYYTRSFLVGEQRLPGELAMDQELEFLSELYEQRLHGRPQHCEMSCNVNTDPLACCWRRRFAKIDEFISRDPPAGDEYTSNLNSNLRKELAFDQYTREVRGTIHKHLRRNQAWPEGYPKELELELEQFYKRWPTPSAQQLQRFGEDCGLTAEGVQYYYELKRKGRQDTGMIYDSSSEE